MKISQLTSKNIESAAQLHLKCLPTTRSSRMGLAYLNHLYTTLYRYPDLHILLTATEGEKLVGVITITRNLKQTQTYISASLIRGIPHILWAILTRKISIGEIMQQIQFEQQLSTRFPSPFIEILTLFVDSSYRKNGIGKKLIHEAKKLLEKQNVFRIYVDTEKANTNARAFYETIGFKQEAIIIDSVVYSNVWNEKS